MERKTFIPRVRYHMVRNESEVLGSEFYRILLLLSWLLKTLWAQECRKAILKKFLDHHRGFTDVNPVIPGEPEIPIEDPEDR